MESESTPDTSQNSYSNPPEAPQNLITNDVNESPVVSRARKILFRRMLVGVKDGRFFTGTLHCIDKQGNIILQDAVEHRSTRRPQSPAEQRCLGLILIPAACRSSCHVDCSINEQMSLLCLDR